MPYFFILPVYIILFITLIALAIAACFMPRFKALSKYILFGAVGTLFGFIIFNVLVWLVIWFMLRLDENIVLPNWLHQITGLFLSATLLIGPFIVSAVGILLGFLAGLYIVYKQKNT